MDGLAINRVERLDDGSLKVVVDKWMTIADFRKTVFSDEYPYLVCSVQGEEKVRVSSATQVDEEKPFGLTGGNGIFFECFIQRRELTDEEIKWCENTFMYGGENRPDELLEFTIPNPEVLREATRLNDASLHPELNAVVSDAETRDELITSMQKRYAEQTVRSQKIDEQVDDTLLPEWNPSNSRKSRETLKQMARMAADAHLSDLQDVLGVDYMSVIVRRFDLLEFHEPHLDKWRIPPLNIAGHSDWSYCRICGGIHPEEEFLHPVRKGTESQTIRSCVDCANKNYRGLFTEEAVATAKDEHAKNHGGQRRLDGFDSEGE